MRPRLPQLPWKLTCKKDIDDIRLADDVQGVPYYKARKPGHPNDIELEDRNDSAGVEGRPREWV